MNTFESQILGKKVLIFGVGRQGGGTGDAEWLKDHGAIVRLSDSDPTIVPEGQNKEQIDWADIIVKNPGVPDDNELIEYAKSLGKPVLTSIAIFVKYSPVKTIGVTGTRGKSTTVALISKVLEVAYPGQIIVGGNIPGTSGLSLFDQVIGKKYAVLELSSFQLHNFHDLHVSPNIAVITNLYPDHLNRYPSMSEYSHDKTSICCYQQSYEPCFFNLDNPGAVEIAATSPGQKNPYSSSEVLTWETSLPGLHNRENIAAMFRVAQNLGVSEAICKKIVRDFTGIPFRQEKIAEIDGVTYINDTTASTPTATIKALQGAICPTIWITGGSDKNIPFDELITEVKDNKNLKNIVILGSKNIPNYINQLKNIAGDKILGTVASMQKAVDLSRSVAVSGDSILLSPAFASFDLFQNEFERGRQFNDIVKNL
jgi:UDP-N-acetylmuramoylalanine--D-glutamate ligase